MKRILLVLPFYLALSFLGASDSCNPQPPPYTGLKKTLEVLPVDAYHVAMPDGTQLDISEGLRSLMTTVLEQGNRYRVNPEDTVGNANPPVAAGNMSGVTQLPLKDVSPTDGLGPLESRPQYYLKLRIISFQLHNFALGIHVGYNAGGQAITGGIGPGGSVKFDFARIDVAISVVDPYTLRSAQTQTLNDSQATINVAFDVSVSHVNVGVDLVYQEPLKLVIMEIMRRSLKTVDPFLDSKPFEARVIEGGDGILWLNAGADANIPVAQTFQAYRQMAFLDSHDNLVGVFDSRIGSLDVTDVGSSIAKAFVKQQTLSIQPGDLVREIRGGAQ
jgi:hypothetical protein